MKHGITVYFFGDFTDFEEVTAKEAEMFIKRLVVA